MFHYFISGERHYNNFVRITAQVSTTALTIYGVNCLLKKTKSFKLSLTDTYSVQWKKNKVTQDSSFWFLLRYMLTDHGIYKNETI